MSYHNGLHELTTLNVVGFNQKLIELSVYACTDAFRPHDRMVEVNVLSAYIFIDHIPLK